MELGVTRGTLRRRRKGTAFQVAARTASTDPFLMKEPLFFDGGVIDLAAETWDFMDYPKLQRVVTKASIRADMADVAWGVLRRGTGTSRRSSRSPRYRSSA